MAIIRFYCPNCGEAFPWFIARSQRSYSFFEGTKVKCSKCGQISRIKVSIWRALISWTLTLVLIWALLASGAKHLGLFIAHVLKPLLDVSPGLYGALVGALGGLVLGVILGLTIGIGLRQGLEVVVDKERIGPLSSAEKIQK